MTSRESTRFLPLAHSDSQGPAFKRSARDFAWLLGIGAVQWPWLLKSLSGGRPSTKRRLLARLGLAADALPNLGSWKADTGFLTLIVDHIERARPQMVVEFGAGASSLIIARALQLWGGGRLTSFDQHPGFVAATREWLAGHGLEADLRPAPLGPPPGDWPGLWYQPGPLPERIDLLIVDGPPWTIHPLTRGSADSLFARMAPGGVVMLDDAARPGERIVAARWRRRWPQFRFDLVKGGTKGTLIGTRRRD